MCGINAPKAIVGNTMLSTAAPATFEALDLLSQDPSTLQKTAQSVSAAKVKAEAEATATIPAVELSMSVKHPAHKINPIMKEALRRT